VRRDARLRREATIERLKGSLWVLPTCSIVLALAVGSALAQIDVDPSSSPWRHLVFQGTVDDARNLLIGIASTMVTVIALVLGLTVVALQLASTQFSPRLLRNFLRDRVNQIVLSVFVATFTYSSAGLYTVGISAGERTHDYPRVAVTGALVLLFASMVMLIFFAHHLAHSIQIDEVMKRVEFSTLQVIAQSLPTRELAGASLDPPPQHAWPVPAYRSGYVQTLHPEILLPMAVEAQLAAAVVPMVGEHVVEGAPVLYVWSLDGAPPRVPPEVVAELTRDAVRIGFERTLEQDAALGIRQLADIGSKALSPAINDPYTAVQALDHLSVILSALAPRALGGQAFHAPDGSVRVTAPGRDLAYYVDLACGQIRRYGASEPRVMNALLRLLGNTGRSCRDAASRSVVVDQINLVVADAERMTAQPLDLRTVHATATRLLSRLDAESGGVASVDRDL
jgi:uncharacterized membrane protein